MKILVHFVAVMFLFMAECSRGVDLPAPLRAYAEKHLRIAYLHGLAPEWREAKLGDVVAVRRPDLVDSRVPAYFEVQVLDERGGGAGYMLLASGRHDYPIVQWSCRGSTPSEELVSKLPAGKTISAYYWISPNLVGEDAVGSLVAGSIGHPATLVQQRRTAPLGDYPSGSARTDGGASTMRFRQPDETNRQFQVVHGTPIRSWRDYKAEYGKSLRIYLRALSAAAAPLWAAPTVPIPFTDGSAPQCSVPDPLGTPNYDQVAPYTGPNSSWYESGCGPTAWAILMGWQDRQAARGDARFAPYWGLYKRNGVLGWFADDEVAPMAFDPGPQNTAVQVEGILGTWGAVSVTGPSEGTTEPWRMSQINTYLERQGFADHSIEAVTFDWGGGDFDSLRDRAIQHICVDRVPAVMGLGALSHYGVASEVYGYWFWMNMGWGGRGNKWDSPGVFFAGTLLPKSGPVLQPLNLVAEGGQCLDIGLNSGTAVLTTSCRNSFSQAWLFLSDHTLRGIYGWCLDVDHQHSANGTKIQNYACNGTVAQAWSMSDFQIRQGALCVEVTNGLDADGTPTRNANCVDDWSQQWNLTAGGEIRNSAGRCLSVAGGNTADGTPIEISTCDGGDAQRWIFAPGASFRGLVGKCLTATSQAPGAPLVLSTCFGQPQQQWALNGAIRGFAGKCLDITNGLANTTAQDGQPVRLWDCLGNPNQRWTLR